MIDRPDYNAAYQCGVVDAALTILTGLFAATVIVAGLMLGGYL